MQTSRDERTNTSPSSQASGTPTPVPSPVGEAPMGRSLMESALQQAAATAVPPPMVVTPAGYWLDGTEHRHTLDSAGRALLPAQPAWQPRIDQDDTAKCYRRFFVGRVSFSIIPYIYTYKKIVRIVTLKMRARNFSHITDSALIRGKQECQFAFVILNTSSKLKCIAR